LDASAAGRQLASFGAFAVLVSRSLRKLGSDAASLVKREVVRPFKIARLPFFGQRSGTPLAVQSAWRYAAPGLTLDNMRVDRKSGRRVFSTPL